MGCRVETFFWNATLHRNVFSQEIHGDFYYDDEVFSGVTCASVEGILFSVRQSQRKTHFIKPARKRQGVVPQKMQVLPRRW